MDEQSIVKAGWASVRQKRNDLLRATDHTQLPDNPLDESQQAEMSSYRQQLRDLPTQECLPWEVVWPTKPVV